MKSLNLSDKLKKEFEERIKQEIKKLEIRIDEIDNDFDSESEMLSNEIFELQSIFFDDSDR